MKQGWEYKKLGEVCTIERGGSPRPITDYITDSEDGINWIKIGDAQEGSKYITSTKEKIRPEGLKKSRFVHKGDFILSNSMSFGRPYILKVDGCIHDGWLVIHDENEVFIKDYLYYILSSPIMYAKFSQLAVGGVVNNLNSSLVRKVTIPIPPKSTQLSIISELDKINELIRLKKEQLKDYDNLAQSIFYEMFGDPVENDKGWEVKKLGDYIKVIGGYAFCSKKFQESGIPVLRIGNINTGKFTLTNMVYWQKDERLSRYRILPGDLVISLTGTVGKSDYGNVCILGNDYEEYYLNQRNAKLEVGENLDKFYLTYLLKQDIIKEKLTGISRGVRQANIANRDIENLKFPLPPLPLQHLFAQRIEQIEHQKSEVKKSITDLETLLASRMQYWFE